MLMYAVHPYIATIALTQERGSSTSSSAIITTRACGTARRARPGAPAGKTRRPRARRSAASRLGATQVLTGRCALRCAFHDLRSADHDSNMKSFISFLQIYDQKYTRKSIYSLSLLTHSLFIESPTSCPPRHWATGGNDMVRLHLPLRLLSVRFSLFLRLSSFFLFPEKTYGFRNT